MLTLKKLNEIAEKYKMGEDATICVHEGKGHVNVGGVGVTSFEGGSEQVLILYYK